MSRLEEIKNNHEFRKGEGWQVTTLPEDIDWLIERIEDLDKNRKFSDWEIAGEKALNGRLEKRVGELEYQRKYERMLSKDLYKLQVFLQENPDLSKHRYGESISLIAIDAMKMLKMENASITVENKRYKQAFGEIQYVMEQYFNDFLGYADVVTSIDKTLKDYYQQKGESE